VRFSGFGGPPAMLGALLVARAWIPVEGLCSGTSSEIEVLTYWDHFASTPQIRVIYQS
jgi:hypothetical protein